MAYAYGLGWLEAIAELWTKASCRQKQKIVFEK
jgi:hypothetical protein